MFLNKTDLFFRFAKPVPFFYCARREFTDAFYQAKLFFLRFKNSRGTAKMIHQ
jgi:hypothetical protein